MKNMSREGTGIPLNFVLKQIENEIHAGFAFVAAARQALKLSHLVQAESALDKAAETHKQAASALPDSTAGQMRALTHQLTELRESIDRLHETDFARAAGK
jgi:endonuclease IV